MKISAGKLIKTFFLALFVYAGLNALFLIAEFYVLIKVVQTVSNDILPSFKPWSHFISEHAIIAIAGMVIGYSYPSKGWLKGGLFAFVPIIGVLIQYARQQILITPALFLIFCLTRVIAAAFGGYIGQLWQNKRARKNTILQPNE